MAASHWLAPTTVDIAPAITYQGLITEFSVGVTNRLVTESLDVYYLFATFCWDLNAQYTFKANDGVPAGLDPNERREFKANILVSQTALGNCDVRLKIGGAAGGDITIVEGVATLIIQVITVPSLQLSIAANPTSGSAPLTVSFTSTVTGGVGPYTYAWTFGDAKSSTEANPSHTYTGAGTFTATLVVLDRVDNQKSASTTITVTAAIAATASASVTNGTAPLTVSFTSSASGGTPPYTYEWVFGDQSTSVQQNPSHTYQSPGTFTVTLTVTDAQGQHASKTITIVVRAAVTPSGGELPSWIWYVVIAGVAGGGIAGALLWMRRSRAAAPPMGEAPMGPARAPPIAETPAIAPRAPTAEGMVPCPNCGRMLPVAAEFCGTCGARLK